jgi:cobalt-zinc-cadmium efflux system membrane fusion protein
MTLARALILLILGALLAACAESAANAPDNVPRAGPEWRYMRGSGWVRVRPTDIPPADEVWLSEAQMTKAGIRIAVAAEQDIPQAITVGGRIAFNDLRVTHVFSPVTGRVTRVFAQPGQRLKKGAPLLAIASPDVGQAFSDVVKAQAGLAAGEADFHRQEILFRSGAAPQRDFEGAEDNYRKAKAEYDRAQQRAAALKSGSLDAVTQEYTLRSFIEGEVIARMANPGAEVQGQYSGGTSNELFTIGDIKEVWLFADVQDTDLPRVHVGGDAEIRVVAYPGRVFRGKIDWISETVDPVLRTARVRCVLPNESEELKPEMFATASLVQPPVRRLAVPAETVVRINETSFVFVADGKRPDGRMIFKRRAVALGQREGDLAVIAGGLNPGERVVTEGSISRDQPNDEAWPTQEQLEAAGIKTAVVEERDVDDAVSVGGRLTFDDLRISHVFSPVNGRITKVLAKLGQQVEKGTPLAAISSPDVGQFVSDVVKAKADLIAAEHEHQRQKDLYGYSPTAHAGTLKDLEAAESAWRNAKAEFDRAQQKAQLLKAGSVDDVTQEYILRSPIAGEVVARAANPGLEVQGQYSTGSNVVELFTIGNVDRLLVLGDVYEMDLPHIAKGDDAAVTVAAYPNLHLHGVVDWVASALDPVLRTAKVRCIIDNPDHLLKPEMYESLRISVPGKRMLAIPRQALMRVEKDTVVFVATGERKDGGAVVFKRRKVVALEDRPGAMVPVLNGLEPGETIAIEHPMLLLGMIEARS